MASITQVFNIVLIVALLIMAVFSSPVPNESGEEIAAESSQRQGRFYGAGLGVANANAFASAGATGLGLGYPGMGYGGANAVASATAAANGFGYGK